MDAKQIHCIKPDWPAPACVRAYTTLRTGGVSQAPFDSFNLAYHVGDDPKHVEQNRLRLSKLLELPSEPIWIEQTHSDIVVEATLKNQGKNADASFTKKPEVVCAISTADCVPILLCDRQGKMVAAVHAGWRGIAGNIIENTVAKLKVPPEEILAWLGPAIGAAVYEVGPEVREIFLAKNPLWSCAFKRSKKANHYLADVYQLACMTLQNEGVTRIYGADYCTYTDAKRFFSYRRDGANTGRMASIIWIEKTNPI